MKLFLRQLLWMMIRLLHEAMAMRVAGAGVVLQGTIGIWVPLVGVGAREPRCCRIHHVPRMEIRGRDRLLNTTAR